MSVKADEVYRAGLELDVDERAVVAHSLLASLHSDDATEPEFDAAWSAELRRRIEDIDSGAVSLVDGQDSQARVRKLLAELRR